MARVYVSSVIEASPERVWERVRDFNGLPRWHALIRESRIENGEQVDKFVTDEFIKRTAYGCQVVVTNPTSAKSFILQVLMSLKEFSIKNDNKAC